MVNDAMRREILKTVKIYIAAPYGTAQDVAEFVEQLRLAGSHVVSTWHEGGGDDSLLSDEEYSVAMTRDIDEIHHADLLLVWDPPALYQSGFNRHVEVGLAIGLTIHVMRIYSDEADRQGRGFYRNEKLITPVEMTVEAVVDAMADKLGLSLE